MRKQFTTPFEELISVENLLEVWREFLRGKRKGLDVQEYSFTLMDNILSLHGNLANGIYAHGGYQSFNICDPKPRTIHKASVRDRLLHHALHRKLYPFFSATFIADSFSCQLMKGTHRALRRFRAFAWKAGKNNTRTCWALKCDIKKFFANVNHAILEGILRSYIPEEKTLALLRNIITSFHSRPGVGLPLGNLTSQLFVNIYMNEFDQFAKHTLRAKYYVRYCDDFALFSENKQWLENCVPQIRDFLSEKLILELHPDKVFIRTVASGMDFLGWIHFPHHQIPRTTTKRRMLKRIKTSPTMATISSCLGFLKHGATERLEKQALKEYYLAKENRYPPNRKSPAQSL